MKYIQIITEPRAYSHYLSDEWVTENTPQLTAEQIESGVKASSEEIAASIESIPVNFKVDANVTGTEFTFVLTNLTENKIVYNFKFDLSYFQSPLNNIYAQTLMIVGDDAMIKNKWNESQITLNGSDLFDTFANTFTSKSNQTWTNETLLGFFIRADNPTIDDIDVAIIVPRDPAYTPPAGSQLNPRWIIDNIENAARHSVTFAGNVQAGGVSHPLVGTGPIDFMVDKIETVSHTISNNVLTVNVKTYAGVENLYVEATSGFLPKSIVPLTNGEGSFKVLTTGLDSGDVVKVKMGYKKFSNRTSLEVTL